MTEAMPPATRLSRGHTAISAGADAGLSEFFRLMRNGLSGRLAEIAGHAARLEALRSAGVTPDDNAERLSQLSKECDAYLERLNELAALLLETPLDDDERLLPEELVATAAQELEAIVQTRNLTLRIDTGNGKLAPLYGSRHWICSSIERLIEGLIESAPISSHLLVSVRQVGNHMLMRGSILTGNPGPDPREAKAYRAASRTRLVADAYDWAQLDMAFVQAIAGSHGGMLKADLAESGKLHHFLLTLPTGMPKRKGGETNCNICALRQQTLQYANDLAEMMARESATPHLNGDAS